MLLAATEYVRPASLEQAIAALGSSAGASVRAGGQTLINVLKQRAASVELLVDISRVADLRIIDVRADGQLRNATTTPSACTSCCAARVPAGRAAWR